MENGVGQALLDELGVDADLIGSCWTACMRGGGTGKSPGWCAPSKCGGAKITVIRRFASLVAASASVTELMSLAIHSSSS